MLGGYVRIAVFDFMFDFSDDVLVRQSADLAPVNRTSDVGRDRLVQIEMTVTTMLNEVRTRVFRSWLDTCCGCR
jgi:hypothetical protein